MKNLRTLLAITLVLAASAHAQQTIDHARALAGNISPGDQAGYPITLSQPGHYKLTGNLVVPAGVFGIQITGPRVTLDLNGFSITGPTTCSREATTKVVVCSTDMSGYDGVMIHQHGAVVQNGTVAGFRVAVTTVRGATLDNLTLTQNALSGLYASGGGLLHVTRVVSRQNGVYGLNVVGAVSGRIDQSVLSENGQIGAVAGGEIAIYDSVVTFNRSVGLSGMAVRGVRLAGNTNNRDGLTSMGGNLDEKFGF